MVHLLDILLRGCHVKYAVMTSLFKRIYKMNIIWHAITLMVFFFSFFLLMFISSILPKTGKPTYLRNRKWIINIMYCCVKWKRNEVHSKILFETASYSWQLCYNQKLCNLGVSRLMVVNPNHYFCPTIMAVLTPQIVFWFLIFFIIYNNF